MDQSAARKRAKELGGIAVGARWSDKRQSWVIGGYSPHAQWIVIDIAKAIVLDDGAQWPGNPPVKSEEK
jgi:hypothetical protein